MMSGDVTNCFLLGFWAWAGMDLSGRFVLGWENCVYKQVFWSMIFGAGKCQLIVSVPDSVAKLMCRAGMQPTKRACPDTGWPSVCGWQGRQGRHPTIKTFLLGCGRVGCGTPIECQVKLSIGPWR